MRRDLDKRKVSVKMALPSRHLVLCTGTKNKCARGNFITVSYGPS